jgi:hypothetical protein
MGILNDSEYLHLHSQAVQENLKIKALQSFKMLGFAHPTVQHHDPEDCENLESHTIKNLCASLRI